MIYSLLMMMKRRSNRCKRNFICFEMSYLGNVKLYFESGINYTTNNIIFINEDTLESYSKILGSQT
jgi:hypothetical protein